MMQAENIRKLRKERGLTQGQLAKMLHCDRTIVTKMESNGVGLNMKRIHALATALDVPISRIVGEEPSRGFSEDAAPYEPPKDHYLHKSSLPENHFWYMVKSDVLSELDVLKDDLLEVSIAAEDLKKIESGAIVVTQVYSPDALQAETQLRQFIKPNLLITNRRKNNTSMNLLDDNSAIMGLVKRVHRDRVL